MAVSSGGRHRRAAECACSSPCSYRSCVSRVRRPASLPVRVQESCKRPQAATVLTCSLTSKTRTRPLPGDFYFQRRSFQLPKLASHPLRSLRGRRGPLPLETQGAARGRGQDSRGSGMTIKEQRASGRAFLPLWRRGTPRGEQITTECGRAHGTETAGAPLQTVGSAQPAPTAQWRLARCLAA